MTDTREMWTLLLVIRRSRRPTTDESDYVEPMALTSQLIPMISSAQQCELIAEHIAKDFAGIYHVEWSCFQR